MAVEHKLVTHTYYSIVTGESNRGIYHSFGKIMDDFSFEEQSMAYSVLRNNEGDFEGVCIFQMPGTKYEKDCTNLRRAVCEVYGVDASLIGVHNLRITCI